MNGRRISPHILRPFLFAFGAVCLIAAGEGCNESCTGVVCEPSPPVLSVVVIDTIPTTINVSTLDTNGAIVITTVDTVLPQRVLDATVTLWKAGPTDSLAEQVGLLELAPQDSVYYVYQALPATERTFSLSIERGEKRETVTGLKVQQIEGCCGYDLIGELSVNLVAKP